MRALILVALLVGTAWAVYAAVAYRGANPVFILATRYGVMPWVVGAATIAGATAVVLAPVGTLIGLVVVASVGQLTGRGPASLWHLIRRGTIRARWASVARSSGLGVTKDRRPTSLLGSTTKITGDAVEHLPQISWGRACPGGVRWRLTPARGATLDEVAAAGHKLAAGLRVAAVEIEQTSPHRGALVAYWHKREDTWQ